MGVLVHFHFDLPFDGGSDAAGPLPPRALFERAFVPAVSAIQYSSEKYGNDLLCAVSCSGHFLSELLPADAEVLRKLVEHKRAEVLLTPYAVAANRFAQQDRLTEQLELNAEEWRRLSVPVTNGVWLPAATSESNLAALAALQCSPVIVPSTICKEELSGFSAAGDFAGSWIVSRVQQGDLAKRHTSRSALSLRGADHSAATVIFSNSDLFPENLSAIDRRAAFLDLMKDLRGEFSQLTRLPSAFAAEFESGETREPSEALKPPNGTASGIDEMDQAAARVETLAEEMAPLPDLIKTMPKEAENLQHLLAARKALALARSAELWSPVDFKRPSIRRCIYEQVNIAQVEIDIITQPDIDPVLGWVRHMHLPNEESVKYVAIDTQLMRLHFDLARAGALTEFDYKGRKANLASTAWDGNDSLSFIEGLLELQPAELSTAKLPEINRILTPAPGSATGALITRQTKDLTGLRLIRTAGVRGLKKNGTQSARIVKHYTVKAGIGAHLPNVTTGFSQEYWLEGDSAPGSAVYCVSRYSLMLPSANPDSISFRPLASAGGEAPKSIPYSQFFLNVNDIEGGLYGLRLIDGVSNFVLDIRSAKQLNGIGVLPLERVSDTEMNGIVLLFFVGAGRIFEDDKANTIFFSIR